MKGSMTNKLPSGLIQDKNATEVVDNLNQSKPRNLDSRS
jgi:hypothetical protein